MYVLMRGCAAAFLLAAALYSGLGMGAWALRGPAMNCPLGPIVLFGSLILAIVMTTVALRFQRKPAPDERIPRCLVFWLLAVALAVGGFSSARQMPILNPATLALPSRLEDSLKLQSEPIKFQETERALEELRLSRQIRANADKLMFALAVAAVLLSLLCLSAYRGFAVNFAATVYRDYYNKEWNKPSENARALQ